MRDRAIHDHRRRKWQLQLSPPGTTARTTSRATSRLPPKAGTISRWVRTRFGYVDVATRTTSHSATVHIRRASSGAILTKSRRKEKRPNASVALDKFGRPSAKFCIATKHLGASPL